IFTIEPGSASFMPVGAPHYIRNTGPDVLHLIVGFSNEQADLIALSNTLGFVPRNLMAQTFGLPTQSFPPLSQQKLQLLVKAGQVAPTGASPSSPFTVNIKDIPPVNFPGGTLTVVSPQSIPTLDGITMVYL